MDLPVGYRDFHSDDFINYQLNRWCSLGYTREEDLEHVGQVTSSTDDYVEAFVDLAETARRESRLKNASFYYRAAEFLASPERNRKGALYDSFRALFDRAFEDAPFERNAVPYQDGQLPVLRYPARGDKKGTLVAHGGFDSVIEAFHVMWTHFAGDGYEVVAFEGPGQGAALRRHGLLFDHDWEKPTSAVLDHFDLSDISLFGASMGGYWGLRAAAFEKRIQRVIAFPPVYDWTEVLGELAQGITEALMKADWLMNAVTRLQMTVSRRERFMVEHVRFITDRETPLEASKWVLEMNKEHLHSEKVDQDVLLLGGENDAFQPPILLRKQAEALTEARSVTTRVFTEAEHADQHCQMGNLRLALTVMTDWLDRYEDGTSR